MTKALKTPLRYPGGKSRATKKLQNFFPDMSKFTEYREPFIGGGSVGIFVTKEYPHLDIWVNDLYEPLYNFWKNVQKDAPKMSTELKKIKLKENDRDKARVLFDNEKERVNDTSLTDFERALSFYIVNKCSFSGLTESSSFSPQASEKNFTMLGIEKLAGYKDIIAKWKITNQSYETLLNGGTDTFVYVDPPYDIKDNLYGKKGSMHSGFSHDEFAENMNNCQSSCVVSYNTSQIVKDRFNDPKWQSGEFDLTYTMRSTGSYMQNQDKRKELVIINY